MKGLARESGSVPVIRVQNNTACIFLAQNTQLNIALCRENYSVIVLDVSTREFWFLTNKLGLQALQELRVKLSQA
jgi:hypothetical protein